MDGVLREGRTAVAKGRMRSGVPAASAVYEDLRARIVSMELAPETTLSRGDIAKEYGVSQTPVREALQRLETDGLVKIFPQSRTIVSRIDMSQLHEAHFLRIAIESEVARRLAENPNGDALARARGLVAMQGAISQDLSQIETFNQLDDDFHKTLLEGVGRGELYNLLRSRSGHLARVRRLDLPRKGKLLNILAAHRTILDAIDSGSPTAATAAVREHLSDTMARIDTIHAEHPEMFEV